VKTTLLFAVSALALLGTVVALDTAGNGGGRRADGLMPEVVSTADCPRLTLDEIVVRASHLDRLADGAVRLSGINQ